MITAAVAAKMLANRIFDKKIQRVSSQFSNEFELAENHERFRAAQAHNMITAAVAAKMLANRIFDKKIQRVSSQFSNEFELAENHERFRAAQAAVEE